MYVCVGVGGVCLTERERERERTEREIEFMCVRAHPVM